MFFFKQVVESFDYFVIVNEDIVDPIIPDVGYNREILYYRISLLSMLKFFRPSSDKWKLEGIFMAPYNM
jgi:hypothetical protein